VVRENAARQRSVKTARKAKFARDLESGSARMIWLNLGHSGVPSPLNKQNSVAGGNLFFASEEEGTAPERQGHHGQAGGKIIQIVGRNLAVVFRV